VSVECLHWIFGIEAKNIKFSKSHNEYKYAVNPNDVFSSPGPKVQVNYCHHLTSVVCRLSSVVCRLSSVNFSHFKLLLRNHLADWNRT
jgi:hypothetical protein